MGLSTTPIIDQRSYLDLIPGLNILNIHTADWSYVIRQRMVEHGIGANQVLIENGPFATVQNAYELSVMDQWLTNIDADGSHRSLQSKVATDKPGGLGDGCFLTDATPPTLQPLSYRGTGWCATAFPVAVNPRLAAGQPLDLSVMKCRLAPIDFSAYRPTFTPAQQATLMAVFPDGICDYSRPGVGERAPRGTWLSYGT